MYHIEAGGGGPYHFFGVLQSGGTGGAPARGRDVGLVSGNGEADSVGPNILFVEWDGETVKEVTGWDLAVERIPDLSEGGGY